MGIDLLRLEMDTLWGQGRFGRHRTHLAVVLAAAADGEEMRFGPGVSEQLRAACAKLANSLFDCAEVLEQFQPCELGGGPSYLVSNPIEPPLPPGLQIIRSHQRSEQTLPTSLEPWWTEEEWRELLAARLGPWAMGLLDDQIVSICHTPVAGAKAAEAGIWTHPEFRRRG
ncbi:MAG TPA: hypothetical protein VG944_16890, partial [Fimbriimonas sp.]|nr:hypothetical protein [Fimbriimonas sp.]